MKVRITVTTEDMGTKESVLSTINDISLLTFPSVEIVSSVMPAKHTGWETTAIVGVGINYDLFRFLHMVSGPGEHPNDFWERLVSMYMENSGVQYEILNEGKEIS